MKLKKFNFLNITFNNNNEVKEFLSIIGISVRNSFLIDENGNYIKNSNGKKISYKNLDSVLPGSKKIIERNDFTAVSNYYNKFIDI